MALPGVRRYVGDQCVYQPEPIFAHGEWGFIRKATGWATNCPEIGKRLSKRCKGDHYHVNTEGGVITNAKFYSKRLVSTILGGLATTLRGFKRSYSCLKKNSTDPQHKDVVSELYRMQRAAMTVLGLTDVATEKEVDDEIKYHERRQWPRPGKDKSARQSVLIGQEKLIDCHRCISELKGLVCEERLDEDSCGSITDEEGPMYQDMTPNGKPLPYLDGLSLDVKVPSTKKKMRNKKKQSQMMCQPCGLMECEAMGLASCGPLTKDHFRTHMPKHPGCEICRLTKPQASPHLRISDKRKKAFGKIDDEGNLIEIR